MTFDRAIVKGVIEGLTDYMEANGVDYYELEQLGWKVKLEEIKK